MPKYKFDGKEWSVLTLKTWITPVEGDDMKAISLQLRNQSTVKLFNHNLFRLYLYDAVFYLLNGLDWIL